MATAQPTAPSQSHGDTADTLLDILRRLCAEGRVAIQIDPKRLTHIDSPVAFEADSNQWVYALLVITGIIWWQHSWQAGMTAAAVSIAIYLTVAKRIVRGRIDRRVREQVLNDVVRWRKLWSFGGIVLTEVTDAGEASRCEAPAGNWMEFTRRLARG